MADRATYLGGTDVAAVCRQSDWKTRMQVYLEKTGQKPEIEMNETMKWGQLIEPLILDEWVSRAKDRSILHRNWFERDPDQPWRGGTADAIGLIDGRKVLLEAKKIGEKSRGRWASEIPTHYLYQVQHYMDLHGCEQAIFCVLFGGSEYAEFTVQADIVIQAEIRRECERFWRDHVEARIPPSPEANDEPTEGLELAEQPVVKEDVRLLTELRTHRSALDERIEAIEERIQAAAKGRAVLWHGQAIGSWSTVSRKEQVLPAKTYQQWRWKPTTTLERIFSS